MALTTYDIIDWVCKQTGHKLNEDEGISYGPARQPVRGVTLCWMPDPDAVRQAVAAGHQLLIHHESLTYPYPTFTFGKERQFLAWPTNSARLTALAAGGLTACRLHGAIDEIAIMRGFGEAMELGPAVERGRGRFEEVFEIPPVPYAQFIERVKKAFGMPAVRATCCQGMDRTVRRVGLAAGGLGLFVNIGWLQAVMELGVDVMVAGETDNYAMRFCAERGVDLVEASHELSENPGLAQFADLLAKAFPALDVRMIRQECVWRMA